MKKYILIPFLILISLIIYNCSSDRRVENNHNSENCINLTEEDCEKKEQEKDTNSRLIMLMFILVFSISIIIYLDQ